MIVAPVGRVYYLLTVTIVCRLFHHRHHQHHLVCVVCWCCWFVDYCFGILLFNVIVTVVVCWFVGGLLHNSWSLL